VAIPACERRPYRAIVWSWRAYAQGGALAMQSEASFETLTECVQDARLKGYDKT
jgi:hypothetical protein